MPFTGTVGLPYTRRTITEALGLNPTHQGKWGTGYPSHDDEFFVFANIDQAGQTGHDYNNHWIDGFLHWTTVGDGQLEHPTVANLVSGRYTVHVFYRYSGRSSFIYAGPGVATNVRYVPAEGDGNPEGGEVQLTWEFPERVTNPRLRWSLADEGFDLDPPLRHIQSATKAGLTVYIKQTEEMPLVLPPYYADLRAALGDVEGIMLEPPGAFYHYSNMAAYPRRVHTGNRPIHFGVAVGFASDQAMDELVGEFVNLDPILREEREVEDRRRGRRRRPVGVDPRTETEAVRAERLGQAGFRADLLDRHNAECPLTGIAMPELLRASHIKPWHQSSNDERLDPNNGILLSIHLDLLFDKGLITFNQDGTLEVSPLLDPRVGDLYNLRNLPELRFGPEIEAYMAYHRGNVFRR